MNNQPIIPDASVDARLINNLRRARLDFEEVGLQLEEIIAKFDATQRQQRWERIRQKQQQEAGGRGQEAGGKGLSLLGFEFL